MYIALALEKLLKEKDEAKKLAGAPLKALCQMEDSLSVADHIWLSGAGLKLEYVSFVKTGNPILDNGLIAGSLSALATDGILITDDETLLNTGRVENGKYSLLFAGSIKDALEAYKKSGKKQASVRKSRKEKETVKPATVTEPETRNTEATVTMEQKTVAPEQRTDETNHPDDAFMNAPEEEVVHGTDMEPDNAMQEVATKEVLTDSTDNTDADESTDFGQTQDAAETTAQIVYDQTDRVNARVYPDDFDGGGIEGEAYEAFKKLATEYGAKHAMVPYILTVFQITDSADTFYYRLNEVISNSNEANDIFLSLGEHYDELKELADKVEPIDAYI